MDTNKFIRFHEVNRDDLTLPETMEYLEVTSAQLNRLRKLNLLTPVEGGKMLAGKKLYFLLDDVKKLWDQMLEFDKNL